MERNKKCMRVPMINVDTGVKFTGNIRRTHLSVFINSIRNMIRNIRNFKDIKDIISQNLRDTAAIWYSSQQGALTNFQEFDERFIRYFWGETAQAKFGENLYF